jgi:hypothetical protein
MKRIPYFVLIAFTVVGCANIPGLAAPTVTPLPTKTAVPTETPLPTETPTLVPTATPNKTATAVAHATEAAGSVLDEVERLLDDTEIPYQGGHLAWQQTKPFSINMSGPSSNYMEIDKKLTAGNFIMKSDVTWNATGLLLCGAIFRSEPNLEKGRQYQFLFMRFSGLPAWAIELHEFGQFRNTPSKVQYSDSIDQGNGGTNQFVLIAQDEQFNLYLNNVSQGRYFDYSKQRMDGAFAFLGLQQSGEGSCEFENSWIWSLDD